MRPREARSGSELVPGGRNSSYLEKKHYGAGHELMPGGRISSYLKNTMGQSTSSSQEAGSARTVPQKRFFWGRVRAGRRRKDQLVLQKKNCGAGYELIPGGRIS